MIISFIFSKYDDKKLEKKQNAKSFIFEAEVVFLDVKYLKNSFENLFILCEIKKTTTTTKNRT